MLMQIILRMMSKVLNILVADDDLFFRSFMCKMIEDMGHKTSQAADGDECIIYAKKNQYDAIFLDLIMPTLCGDEVLKMLRNEQNYNGMIVICSAEDENELMQEYFDLGANAYLAKPVKHNVLTEVINRIIETG